MTNSRAISFRVIFVLAAIYNFAFGLWAGIYPLAFFRLFHLPMPRYPSIWACVGMIVGLYGIAYASVAWKPDRGAVFVWIGLAGKVLGPIGWLMAIGRGELPPRTFPVILFNDLVGWFPFLFYLIERLPQRRAVIAWSCVAVHVGACFGLLAVRGGTEAVMDFAERQAWVRQWMPIWVAAWLVWSLASMSLLALMVVWSERLIEVGVARSWTITGCLVVAVGLVCDLTGETINVTWVTRPGQSVEEFARAARWYLWLGAGAANGLYCVAGMLLSVLAWRAGQLRRWLGALGFAMWTVGLGLTAATIFDYRLGMIATGGATMALFIPWAACLGCRLGAERVRIEVHSQG
jgi:hypothetical protein